MPEEYFRKFPNIEYNGQIVKDITRRNVFKSDQLNSPYVFYPYELKHELRADQIAEFYYEDPYQNWLIYLANGIVDPYYGWYLSEQEFNDLMEEKYGSVADSLKKIIFYRNNWHSDTVELTPSFYENNLLDNLKKYYTPVWSPVSERIVSYKRREIDTTMNTNKILEYTITANNGSNSFTSGEIVDLKQTGQDTTVATGELVLANSSIVRIQSVSGTTTANSTLILDIVGETSFTNVSVNAVSDFHVNITDDEAVYWSAVSYNDWEREINEQRKNLLLISEEDAPFIISDFEEKIQEDVDPETGLSEQ